MNEEHTKKPPKSKEPACSMCGGSGEVIDVVRSVRAGIDINKPCRACQAEPAKKPDELARKAVVCLSLAEEVLGRACDRLDAANAEIIAGLLRVKTANAEAEYQRQRAFDKNVENKQLKAENAHLKDLNLVKEKTK